MSRRGSSGSATVVALGEVPMALGGDQGGSIRIPAAFCGIYGLKPTHGLVPYTGIMPIELTLAAVYCMARVCGFPAVARKLFPLAAVVRASSMPERSTMAKKRCRMCRF